MAQAERMAALKKRRQAIAIIKNIRRTRRVLSAQAFDDKTFDALNGKDCGIEALVGHSVMFGSLDETERLALRREINAKLFESEQQAFGVLREAAVEYFAELQKVIDRADEIGLTDRTLVHLNSKKQTALEAFENFKISEGALDCERCVAMLEHLKVMAEELNETVPEIEHDLDEEEEYTEEQHEHEDELPDEDDDESIEEEDDDEDDDEEEEETDEPEEGESDESEVSVDTTWIESEEAFRDSASKFIVPVDSTMKEAGFTQERAVAIIESYPCVMKDYTSALKNVRDAVAADTCTVESLLRGSKKFYKKIDKMVNFAESLESLRTALIKSCKDLTAAAHEMMLKDTRDAML